jgi:4-amino-4-deoxy-L-arabinose transferase-like glycosyltransferase
VWTAVGLAIRVASVLVRSHQTAGGDSYYYFSAANLLVGGHGFVNPFDYDPHNLHQVVQTAQWPPLFVFVMAIPSALGFHTFFAHRVWCGIVGAAAVVACGYTGREIGGRRVGLLAAFFVAVYPNIWMSDELALSETLTPLLVALVLLAAYRFWKRPGWWTAIGLGAAIAVAALARDELSLLALFIFVPMVLLARTVPWRRRFGLLAAGTLAAVVIVGPWIGYNMSRFHDPVFISSGFGVTLESANCDVTYSGPSLGYWSYPCRVAAAAATASRDRGVDESVQAANAQAYALSYIGHHTNRIVPVVAARIGRAFGFFHPFQQVELDSTVETRPHSWALVGLWTYFALFALAIGGAVVLRRRRVPILPLLAMGLVVVVSVVITFGNTRYRTPFEVSLVLLASVQLDWIWSRLRRPRAPAGGDPGGGSETSSRPPEGPDPGDGAESELASQPTGTPKLGVPTPIG